MTEKVFCYLKGKSTGQLTHNLCYTHSWQLAPDWGCCNVEQSSYVGYRTSFYWDSHRTIFLLVE